jgi:molybdopterin-guanine dinucleotide biosynthesis protein A
VTEIVTGVVLAGGRSTRMGVDKRHLRVADTQFLSRAVKKLRPICDEIIIAVAKNERLKLPKVKIVTDFARGKGPMAGICSALCAMRGTLAVVLACDLPMVGTDFLQFLVRCARDFDIVVPKNRGQLEPLAAVYRASVREPMRAWVAAERLSLSAFIRESGLRIRYVGARELSQFGPPSRIFLNVNTPADYARAVRFASANAKNR